MKSRKLEKPEIEISVLLTPTLDSAVKKLALEFDVTVGTLARYALQKLVRDQKISSNGNHETEKVAAKIDELKLEFLRSVENAKTWAELQKNMNSVGFELVPRGGGLVVKRTNSESVVCKASDLGFGYAELIRKFGEGFPGHPHTWLVEKVLGEDQLIDTSEE